MDYDDNDFQSQNLHLAGEGSTNFPPVLRPYALPKFDFDESLQGHLRFDSLVETEVFLGIESNEDNQWIDAYSRGSSGIEFSSTAAQSCSIPRHSNVWSEATSTESVEMLLKSVGQEEFIPGQTAIQETDAFDELGCLAKQMEPNLKPVDKINFRDNVKDLQPPAGMHENLLGSKPDVEMEQSLAGVPEIHEGKSSIDGSSSTMQPRDICQMSGGTVFTDGKSNDTNQRKIETLADSSMDVKTQDKSSASGVKANITTTSKHNISSTSYVLNIQNAQNQVVGMGALEQSSSQIQTNQDLEFKDSDVNIQTSDGNAVSCDANHPDKPISSSPIEDLESGNVVRGLGAGASNSNENATLITNLEVHDQSAFNRCDLQKVAIKDGSSSEGQVDTLEKNYGESSISKEKELLNIGQNEILLSKSEASTFAVGENNISSFSEGNNDSRAGGIYSFGTIAASANPCISGEATQLCENNEPDRQGDCAKFCQDVPVDDQESKKVPFDSSQVNSDVDQSNLDDTGFGSSSQSADGVETVLAVPTVSTNVMSVNNSASQFGSENISTSCEILKVPPTPSRVESTLEVTDHIEIQRVTIVESASIDANENCGARIAPEAGISTVGSSEQEVAPISVTGTDKHILFETSKQLSCESANDSLQNLGTSGAEKCGEPQVKQNVNDNRECTKEVDMALLLCESTKKQGDVVAVSITKDDKGPIQDNQDKSVSKLSGDIVPAAKGSVLSAPLPDSHTELHENGCSPAHTTNNAFGPSTTFGSPPKADKDQDQVKVSANLNPPVGEFINKDATNILSAIHNLKGNDTSKDERCLTPEVMAKFPKEDAADLTTKGKDFGKGQPVSDTAVNNASMATEVSASASRSRAGKTKIARNTSHESPQTADGVSKGTPERKPRRASKTAGKESSRKGSQMKEKTPARQSRKRDRSACVPVSPPPGFQLMQSNEVQTYGHIDAIGAKSFSLSEAASTSNFPDLNTSASPTLFQQPFTDIQQIQLRAQIFVYGTLIQGTAPDEAHMISAFGGPDGGRNTWEKTWRSCMERQHGQKSHPVNLETPPQSRSAPRATDSAVKQSAVQGKGLSSPLGRASNKGTPTVLNPLIPLSSPLWSLPTPTCDALHSNAVARGSIVDYPQALSSVPPYQTPPLRNFPVHNTSWMSQVPVRGPWITSPAPAPAPDHSSNPSASPITDTIKFSSGKGSSVPLSSAMKNVQPNVPASGMGLQSISVGTTPLDTVNVTASHAQASDPKPKKRKKGTVSEDLGRKAPQFQSQLELTPGVSNHIATAAAIASVVNVEDSVVSTSSPSLPGNLKGDLNVEKRIPSEESLAKVKEARVSAEGAAVLSAAAVNHSLEIWKQLDKQKNSGLVSDIEVKLASAAVAVSAAAAVAKAAAAVADVASNAALQAKLMADEALAVSNFGNSSQISISDGLSNLGKATPASILKGASGANSSASIIVAAKEAARRKVEAASAARKRAENMDAIVKAAELAAEAVAQAGKIVTMGDPLPLSDLIEAGREGCWKSSREPTQQVGLLNAMTSGPVNADNVGERPETSHTYNRDISLDKIGEPVAASEKFTDGISTSINTNEKNSIGSKAPSISYLDNPIDVLPESETEIQASFSVGNGSENLEGSSIKEGSLVEVFKDGDGFKAAWFTANILSLNDGKAHVCYNVLVADEGPGPLKEWVSLHGEGDKPPRIRTARPISGLHNEGTRKRRRSTMIDRTWSVGDRVEAWIQESWQEGVITDKKKDETLTVHFPGSGVTSVFRAWHLRPCLIWKDGKWIDSPKAEANDGSTREGDTPHEKRPKLGSPSVKVKGKDKMSKGIDAVDSGNPGELRLLDLTENDKVFNIGKNSKNENKPGTRTMVRTGLQKEGSRVIFGVPKPGKKRKFMEVSKHYVAGGTTDKINDGNDSVKLANFMPQGSGSRSWRNNSKIDSKEKLGVDPKPKTFKPIKPHSVLGRVMAPKGNASSTSGTNDQMSRTERIRDSSSQIKKASESENQTEIASDSGAIGAAGGPILFSSLASSIESHPTKKTSTSRASKGKLAPAGGKLAKVEVEKSSTGNQVKSTSEVTEPRRSNRRIQPTSRLLEGLQSSLIISKIPEKGQKNQNRTASRGNNQG